MLKKIMRFGKKQTSPSPEIRKEKFYPGLADFRRSVLLRHTSLPCDVLELGAFATPTILPSEAQLKILDFFTTEELKEQAIKIKADPDSVLPVDYVCHDDDYLSVVQDKFDIVIANHVFEHIDNPILWLQTIRKLMRDDGTLLLVLPDKKHSFDKFRADTPLTHLLYDYFVPDGELKAIHALETALYYDLTYIGQENKPEHKFDIERLRRSLNDDHPGIHCHVFQAETFENSIIKPLLFTELVDMSFVDLQLCRQFGEFAIILKAGKSKSQLEASDFFAPATDSISE